jgi:hypothetical protein
MPLLVYAFDTRAAGVFHTMSHRGVGRMNGL